MHNDPIANTFVEIANPIKIAERKNHLLFRVCIKLLKAKTPSTSKNARDKSIYAVIDSQSTTKFE